VEQNAVVVRVEAGRAWVEVGGPGAGCGRCHEAGGCQSGVMSQLFRRGPRCIPVADGIGAVPGEHVVVQVADGALLSAAVAAYLLPVLGLVAGAAAGEAMAPAAAVADFSAAIGAAAGFAAAVLASVWFRNRGSGAAMRPVLLRRGALSCVIEES